MITKPERTQSGSNTPVSETSRSAFETLLQKTKTLAVANPDQSDEKSFRPKVLAAANTPVSDKAPDKPDEYKEITELPEKLDLDTLKVVAQDADAGVIYFEHAGTQYKINKDAAADVQQKNDVMEHLRFGHAVAPITKAGPDSGTQLYNLLQTVAETKGTPVYDAIKDSLTNPDQQLLRKDEVTLRPKDVVSVDSPAEGVLTVELANGGSLVVLEKLAPGAFAEYKGEGLTKDKLAEAKAQGYEEVSALPASLDMEKLKVVSEDTDAGVILFEQDGKKLAISKSGASDQDHSDLLAQNGPPGPDHGAQLYTFLHALSSTQGTQAFDYIKNATSYPDQQLLRKDETSLPLSDIGKVDAPTDGILVVTQNDGKLLVVSKAITPQAFNDYSNKGQTLAGLEKAKGDGYTVANPGDYLPSTEDINSVGGIGDYGPGLIAFTYRKPGGEQQKIIVSEESNPQMFNQIANYRTDIAAQITDIDKIRTDNGLPPSKDTSVDDLLTTEKDDKGHPLSVRDLAIKTLIDEYRAGIKDGSIAKDDPRAKFVRALEAKSMSDNGMSIIPEHGFGNQGSATDPENVTSRDVRDNIFDAGAIDKQIGTLMNDETIVKDLKANHDSALSKVDGGSAKVDETRQKLLDSTSSPDFVKYIDFLQANGHSEIATQEIQTAYAGLADIDPAKADTFIQNLQIDGYTMEVDKLMGDPSKISDDSTALATTDNVTLSLSMLKTLGVGIPRTALSTYENFTKLLLENKGAATDFGKAMASLGDTWQKNGVISLSDINTAVSKELMPNLSAENRSLFTKNLAFLSENGILGSLGGAISVGRIIYQLAGKGGKLADTPRERVGIASDFIGFLGTGSHFATLGTKVYDKLRGTNAYKMMGLDRTLPQIWAKPAEGYFGLPKSAEEVQLKYFQLVDDQMDKGKDVSKALNSQGWDDASAAKIYEGIEEGIAKRGGVSGAGKIARFAGSAIKVIGAVTDVVGGVISVVMAGLSIRDGVRAKDPIKIATGSLSLAGGVSSLIGAAGGIAGALGATGRLVPLLGPVGFLFSGVLSIVGAILGDVKSAKLHKVSMGNWNQIQDFKADGLLKPNGDEAYVWLQTYLSDWGQRDAPSDQSIFDFRAKEWADRSSIKGKVHDDHPDFIGDGNNRRSEDYKFSTRPSKWIDENHNEIWRTTDGYGGEYHDVDKS